MLTLNWSNSFKEKDSEEVIKDSEEHNKIKGSTLWSVCTYNVKM